MPPGELYNASGIRTAKLTGNVLTGYLLDGGNVVAELEDDALSASYLRGANLISRTTTATEYYTFNAHGDVVGLVSAAGTQTKTYDYDAFGNEKDRLGADPNPFHYCGEYFDVESGAYYLRARYYDPSIGRFTQEDTHWNASNMIYGDEPQQIGEYEDPLRTSRYVYAPQITAVMQAGNLYGYGLQNPVKYFDHTGTLVESFTAWSIAELVKLLLLGIMSLVTIKATQDPEVVRAVEEALQAAKKKKEKTPPKPAVSTPAPPPQNNGNDKNNKRKTNCTKNESPIWRSLENVKNSDLKTSGHGASQKFYQWDYTHNDIEVYDCNGKHLGSMDPITGEMYKPPVKGRVLKR